MTYVITILAVLLGVASIVAAVFGASSSSYKKTIETLTKDLSKLRNELSAYSLRSEQEITRRERIILALRSEISEMEKDLATCRDPLVVRERLRKLLSGGS